MTSNKQSKKLANLEKAREAKAKKNPPEYKMFSKEVVALPDDHTFSLKSVRGWIKEAKSHKMAEHRSHVAGVNGALARKEMWAGYINQLEGYLRTGCYTSMFAGGDMEKRVERLCVAMGYYENGKPKREFGVWYSDYRCKWTPELENEERVSYGMKPLDFNEKGHIVVDRISAPTKTKKKTARKKRKMTAEQKAVLVERLKKAREAKKAKAAK